MADEHPALIPDPSTSDAERSLVDDVQQLVTDGKALLEAEIAYQKSRAAVASQGVKAVAGWGALALALVFFALMALIMGLVLGLAELVGPWWATLIAFAAILAAAGISALIAARRWQAVALRISDDEAAR